MASYFKRSWAVVDLDAVAHNLRCIRAHLPEGTMVMGVVKADAYGHGDRFIAFELEQAGVDWLGVSGLSEAISLRRYGVKKPILIFGYTPVENAALLAEYDLTQTVFSTLYARELHRAASHAGITLDVHIKVDTGMGRLGFSACDGVEVSSKEIVEVCSLSSLRAEGIFTHFACADEANPDSDAFTRLQYSRFTEMVHCLRGKGIAFPLLHCCNSGGALRFPQFGENMVRPGIALYGMDAAADCRDILDLRPAMSLYSTITMVKEVEAGFAVSYGREYVTKDKTKLATVSIGYADGYDRRLTNRGRMLVRGQYAPVVGRVCMDQLVLDVTGIPGASSGDLVTVVGKDGKNTLSFDEMASLSGTINYEKSCLIGARVPRIYVKNGVEVGTVDYVLAHSAL